jgi:hypothetical protein
MGTSQSKHPPAFAKASAARPVKFEIMKIEDPRSPDSSGQGIFDRKEVCHFQIRLLTPQQSAGNALTFGVQVITLY